MKEYKNMRISQLFQVRSLVLHFTRLRYIKAYFIFSCISFLLSLLWVTIVSQQSKENKDYMEALHNIGRDFRYANVYRKPKYLPNNLKYLLLWTRRDYAPFTFLEEGQRTFLKNNCSVVNCYVTSDKWLLGTDYTKFHALAFNGRTMNVHQLPRKRSPHQKYIYFNMESAANYPVRRRKYDGFFNWTATYKLSSDIPTPYLLIRDKNGVIVGPKIKMQWRKNVKNIGINNFRSIMNKTKMAAWFVSNCRTKSGRHLFVQNLQDALVPYGYNVDIYGMCGKLRCPRTKKKDGKEVCNVLLKNDYFFYLALENSFSVDYVTEKVLTALNNDVVPIVYGGADYSRFLPPGSYIDGQQLHSSQLAALMDRLVRFPDEYSHYFNWKQYYTYSNPGIKENLCNLCEALNNEELMKKTSIHHNFRTWWNSKT